jgi:hypothetical protein
MQVVLDNLNKRKLTNQNELKSFFNELSNSHLNTNFLVNLQNDSLGIYSIIEKTDLISKNISEKVVILDQKQSKIDSFLVCLNSIKEILNLNEELKKKLGLVETISLDLLKDFCGIIEKYRNFDLDLLKEIYKKTSLGQNSEFELTRNCPVKEFEDLKQQVVDYLVDEFDKGQNLFELFKMFPIMKLNDLGLDKYAAHICRLVSWD